MIRLVPTELPEVREMHFRGPADERGIVMATWIPGMPHLPTRIAQTSVSVSGAGVLRGLHFQHPGGQGKIVTAARGAIYDVAVDVRSGSPTFGQWAVRTLREDVFVSLWIPPGFAHGFLVLEAPAVVHYAFSRPYRHDAQRVVAWDDPALGIPWPKTPMKMSERDRAAPSLAALVAAGQLPRYAARRPR